MNAELINSKKGPISFIVEVDDTPYATEETYVFDNYFATKYNKEITAQNKPIVVRIFNRNAILICDDASYTQLYSIQPKGNYEDYQFTIKEDYYDYQNHTKEYYVFPCEHYVYFVFDKKDKATSDYEKIKEFYQEAYQNEDGKIGIAYVDSNTLAKYQSQFDYYMGIVDKDGLFTDFITVENGEFNYSKEKYCLHFKINQ